jgi:hypothetical protein
MGLKVLMIEAYPVDPGVVHGGIASVRAHSSRHRPSATTSTVSRFSDSITGTRRPITGPRGRMSTVARLTAAAYRTSIS